MCPPVLDVALQLTVTLKKVAKIVAIVIGLFFAGLAYLQYQEIININWNKLQPISQEAALTVLNAMRYYQILTKKHILQNN